MYKYSIQQLYFGTQHQHLYCYCGDNTKYGLLSKKMTAVWHLKKSHNNDKLLEKIMSSSYHIEQKAFIEASCIYKIHTGEKNFCSCCFSSFVNHLDLDRLKNFMCTLVCVSLPLVLQRREDHKYCLFELNLISYMQVFSLIGQDVNLARKIAV